MEEYKIRNAYLEGVEGKKPVDIEVGSADGMWTWKFKYEDGSVGPVEHSDIETSNRSRMDGLIKDIKARNGIK